ncbi:MAG TPA: patatin-like phospholipase family protein [Acidimicrobiales bacterium]|nr:patatin-like phospholipase family protein [Acidimicrobiales bacterium]
MAARIGLVLGAGGVVGHAFHAGVLSALAEATGFDPRRAELIVGTSAGSVVASMLRAGVPAADLAARATGQPLSAEGAAILGRARSSGLSWRDVPARRPLRLGLGAPALLGRAMARPWEARPGMLAAALLPAGTVPTELVSGWLEPLFGDGWPDGLWVCALSLTNGRRTVFGRPEAPRAGLVDAVAASCAIPGLFRPVEIGGIRYVDGGAHSPTNADLVAGLGLDLAVVVSPMSAARPLSGGFDLAGRRIARLTLGREAAAVRRSGTPVLAFQPGVEERAVMGVNAMDPSRREAVVRQTRRSTLARLRRSDLADRLGILASAG